jgi:hypothetical protein
MQSGVTANVTAGQFFSASQQAAPRQKTSIAHNITNNSAATMDDAAWSAVHRQQFGALSDDREQSEASAAGSSSSAQPARKRAKAVQGAGASSPQIIARDKARWYRTYLVDERVSKYNPI